jgi:hypothetical protein
MEDVKRQMQSDLSSQSLPGFQRIEIGYLRTLRSHSWRDLNLELSGHDPMIFGRKDVGELRIDCPVSLDVGVKENIENVDFAGTKVPYDIGDGD